MNTPDPRPEAERPDVIEVHEGRDGQFYLRIVAPNGAVRFDGGQGYSTKGNANRAARRAVVTLAYVVFLEDPNDIRETATGGVRMDVNVPRERDGDYSKPSADQSDPQA